MNTVAVALEESGAPLYNPLSPTFRIDPFPELHRLREREPIHWSPTGYCWVLSRYADIKTALSDKRFAIALDRLMAIPALQSVFAEPYNQIIKTSLQSSDPPDHGRIRSAFGRAFSAARLDSLRGLIQQVVDGLIVQARARGGLDLIADFAHKLPFTVICEILGIPESERASLVDWTHHMMRPTDPTPMSRFETDQTNAAAIGFRDFFLHMAAQHRKTPRGDFFSELVASVDSQKVAEEEFVANLILFFCAGHDTVINLFGNGLLALHRNPRQLQILHEDPTLIRNAIEELLRFDTSVAIARRTAIESVELGGLLIQEGQYVLCLLNAGNRDPEVFPDPDRLDVRRQNVKPLSFGGGIHYCLGAQLARIEGEIGIASLLKDLPTLQLVTLEPEWKQNVFVRGLVALPATL